MSVGHVLLALLEEQPSYGYELKRDYDALFGAARPVPYGQIYATLKRHARDGLVTATTEASATGPARILYELTAEGTLELERWLGEAAETPPHAANTLWLKVVLSLLSDRAPEQYLDLQVVAHEQAQERWSAVRESGRLAESILADYALAGLQADLRWIAVIRAQLGSLKQLLGPPASG